MIPVMRCLIALLLLGYSYVSTATAQQSRGLTPTHPDVLAKVNDARPARLGDAPLPKTVDLSPQMPPVGNQGPQNSCVAWSAAYAMKTYYEKNQRGWVVVENDQIKPDKVFSPAYVYNQINEGKDEGSRFDLAFKILQAKGCATLASMPYNAKDYTTGPNQQAETEASQYRIEWAKNIDPKDTHTLKTYLAKNFPIIIGVKLDDAFENLTAPAIVTKLTPSGGGHAMCVVGYDDAIGGGAFKVMNSWGTEWGDKGFCWITYEVFQHPEMIYEAWIVKNASPSTQAPIANSNASTDEVTDELPVEFSPITIEYDVKDDRYKQYDSGMRLTGSVVLHPKAGKTGEVVIYFANNNGKDAPGTPITAAIKDFSDSKGEACVFTQEFDLSSIAQGGGKFSLYIPYDAFTIPDNVKHAELVAVPIMFVDGIDAADGDVMAFTIDFD